MTNLCTELVTLCGSSGSSLEDFRVPTFGELVATLRAQRGLTQDELGRRVGVDRNTIARTEQDKGTWYRRTALAIFEELGRILPLAPEEAAVFLQATELDPGLARPPFVQSRIDRDIEAEDRGERVPSDPTSVEMRTVHRALLRLLDALGPAETTRLLDTATNAANAARPAPAKPLARQLTVVEPPRVPFPGAVEQVHRTYEVRPEVPPAKPKPKAKPKKRTG